MNAGIHAVAWLVWAIAVAVAVQVAPNPLYVGLTICICWVVVETHNAGGLLSRAFPVLVSVGVVFGAIKVLLTVLTTHGIGRALVTLPEVTVPDLLGGFTMGGTIDDLVLARAVAEALAIVGVMAAFGAFNAVVSHDELVRSFPRTFHEPGVVLTVGLAFVPATIQSVRLAQESDRARTGGTTVRRGRLVRLTVPLLERGMERAVLLSESMDARGFARRTPSAAEAAASWCGVAGLVGLLAMLIALVGGSTSGAAVALVVGIVLVTAAVVLGSRASTRSRYRPRKITGTDVAVAGAAVGGAAALIGLSMGGRSLGWPPEPLAVPTVDPLALAALGLLAVPALIRPGSRA